MRLGVELNEYLMDLIEYGLGTYDVSFGEKPKEDRFLLWGKYRKDQVQQLLGNNPGDIMLGTKIYDSNVYIYVTIIKSSIKDDELSFDEIINEMLYKAWWSVTTYHLQMGPTIMGKKENYLENAIIKIAELNQIPNNADRSLIMECLHLHDNTIVDNKKQLAKHVPYRLLAPFLGLSGNDPLWERRSSLIDYIEKRNEEIKLPYTIINKRGLNKLIHINPEWREFILSNFEIINGWIQYKKVQFLQSRNPGVPGIVYKLDRDSGVLRRLNKARELWKSVKEISPKPIVDIYSGSTIEERFELDHFIPWTYIANDELWNLTPTTKRINSSKNNKLPSWEEFFVPLCNSQYYLCQMIYSNDELYKKFCECRRDNLNALWATESLYLKGIRESEFTNVLEHNMLPIYEAAKLQGFSEWMPVF